MCMCTYIYIYIYIYIYMCVCVLAMTIANQWNESNNITQLNRNSSHLNYTEASSYTHHTSFAYVNAKNKKQTNKQKKKPIWLSQNR